MAVRSLSAYCPIPVFWGLQRWLSRFVKQWPLLHLEYPETLVHHVTASFGIATLHGAQCDAQQLVTQADAQLYKAKHSGRNRVCGVLLDPSVACFD